MFIPAKINSDINVKKVQALKLPKSIAIAYSIQYKDIAVKVKEILSNKYKITEMIQVLGCSKPKFSKDTQAILLIGSGRFHAVSLAAESNLPIYILESNELRKISKEETDSLRKKKLASYMKFLNSEKVGILVSIKPGQENLKKALALKSKIKDKKSYLFIGNEVFSGELENFSDINSWINTACPRLDFDSSVINIGNLNLSHSKDIL
jgi:2-(3-amino-3-carboxypropyl)histidine synthase